MTLSANKGLDEAALRHSTGGDTKIMCEILDLFQEQVLIWKRMLNADNTPQEWADACHILRGAAAGIGALPLASACAKAEQAGRSNPPPSRIETAVLLSEVKTQLTLALEDCACFRCQLEQIRKLK